MEGLKKQRSARRAAFSKAHTAFMSKMDSDASKEEKIVAFQFLETRMTELDAIHSMFNEALFASNQTEEQICKEMDTDEPYKTSYLMAKLKTAELFAPSTTEVRSSTTPTPPSDSKRCMKLPKIEMPKFEGSVREWLPFWSQYKKVHDDPDISKEDKFAYLLQATVPESRANDIVKSFPPTAENYDKVITALKTRFGQDDLVVEFYIRELLGLVLQNAVTGSKKISLPKLYDKVGSHLRALDSLGVTSDKYAAMLYPLVESSLPEETLRAWQRSGQRTADAEAETDGDGRRRDTKNRLTQLLKFLQREVESEERIGMALTGFGVSTEQNSAKKTKGKDTDSSKNVASASVLFVAKSDSKSKCIFCNADHEGLNCETARGMSLEERKLVVRNKNGCFSCLKTGHISKRCRVKVRCDWCTGRHVLLMCWKIETKGGKGEHVTKAGTEERADSAPSAGSGGTTAESERRAATHEHSLATFSEHPTVCLQTLRVKLFSATKVKIVRAIIDTASQRSYICTSTARDVGYTSEGKHEVTHSLFGGVKSKTEKHDLFLIRLKNLEDSYACNFSVMSQNVICDSVSSLPSDVDLRELRAQNVKLTDAGANDGPIEVLIGADVAGKLLTGNKIDLKNGLTAIETRLGWTVMGKLPARTEKTDTATLLTTMFVQEASLSDLWSLEVIGITDPIEKTNKSLRDEKTREFLMQTAKVDEKGRYEVRLPWVENAAPLPSNYDIAEKRLNSCINKLKRQQIFDAYDDIFSEWLKEGIIETVRISEGGHYLPHRPVIKEHGTTKIRPVFDASACQIGYPSLNDCLEKGPNLIELIIALFVKLREGKIGVVADIRKAFLQMGIDVDDRDFLRFLWVKDGKIIILRHCRVVFGLNCSPFLLSAVIELLLEAAAKQIALGKVMSWSKDTVEKLKKSFYVDNCVTSVSSAVELERFIRESQSVMAAGGFDLRGWESTGDTHDNHTTLVLGVLWDKRKDVLSINPALNTDVPEIITKRRILSIVQAVFDPFGFTCPAVLKPKLLLQILWEEKIPWDTEIRGLKRDDFLIWLRELPLLKDISIPRELGDGDLSLHVFGDASGQAYAAVVFARIEHNGETTVKFLIAKTRVAPKKTTIPRLELMAATIAVRLANSIIQSFTRKISRVTYWSDSTTVLAWISRDTQWSTFVFNRVREIRGYSRSEDWRYVPGDANPADLPSRGCNPSHLIKSEWWKGPKWLYDTVENWPISTQCVDEAVVRGECKKTALVRMVNLENRPFRVNEHFASYTRLVRFLAWMKRFIERRRAILREKGQGCSRKTATSDFQVKTGSLRELTVGLSLSFKEVQNAETQLLKHLQAEMFNGPAKEKLTSFKTFTDENGLYDTKRTSK